MFTVSQNTLLSLVFSLMKNCPLCLSSSQLVALLRFGAIMKSDEGHYKQCATATIDVVTKMVADHRAMAYAV